MSVHAQANLRVATFNINWGNVDLSNIQRAIVKGDADIVCLQESTPQSQRFLRQRFAKSYPHIVFRGSTRKFAAGRSGFLSKRPLRRLRYVPPGDGLFGICFASVMHGNRSVRIANVHLSPFVLRRGTSLRQAMHAISAVEAAHAKEMAAVTALLDPTQPTFGTWVFDDASAGLVKEPFVAGVPEMIDVLVKDVSNADNGFRLLFSAQAFPGHQKKLTWLRGNSGGNYYSMDDPPMEGWICPAMFKYYSAASKHLYVKAELIE